MTFFVLPLGSLCVFLQTPIVCFAMQQPGKYRCGCGVLISNVGEAEREHFKSDRHQKWVKSQQTTKTLSAFFVKEQKPVGSSSSSSSITNTSNNYNTNSSSSNINCSSGGSNNNASSSSSSSGGAGEPFSPGRAPQPPPQMFIRVGGVWVGGLVLGGWVPQNPKTPQPLINEVWPRCPGPPGSAALLYTVPVPVPHHWGCVPGTPSAGGGGGRVASLAPSPQKSPH